MKKAMLVGSLFLTYLLFVPIPLVAGMRVNVNVGLPPIVISAGGPPDVVEIPDSEEAYAVPDVNVDLFFWNGWWWRPWEGRWYRSHYYDRDWVHYGGVPRFYRHVGPGWRGYYHARSWHGRPWHYERIPGRSFHGYSHGGGYEGRGGHGEGKGAPVRPGWR